MVALGLVNLALSLWRRDFTLSTGVLVGALLLLGVSSLLRSLSPQLSRQDKIEEQDERNILVNLKTRTSAFRWTRLVSFGLMALLLVHMRIGGQLEAITIGTLMVLVPGMALTNAMREIMAGDIFSGLSRTAESILTATAIALGVMLSLAIGN